jgi:hypothetical protein
MLNEEIHIPGLREAIGHFDQGIPLNRGRERVHVLHRPLFQRLPLKIRMQNTKNVRV